LGELLAVQSDMLVDWYAILEDAFRLMAANSGGRWELSDIVRLIGSRDMQLWISLDGNKVEAVLLTEIVQYPRRKALRFSSCVGREWKNWTGHHRQIEEWARGEGCDLFEVYAPRKWRHAFPEYREYHVMLECDA
jgi:hypothetical protein